MQSTGIYDTLITKLLQEKLDQNDQYYIGTQKIDPAESAVYLSRFIAQILYSTLDSLPNKDDRIEKQINLSNDLIKWLVNYLKNEDLSENIIYEQGRILSALYSRENPIASDFESYASKVTPLSGLSQSELFTGSNLGLSLESEIKREILSSDEICWLVSFIKWTGIRIFADVLKEVTKRGKRVKIITTSYMGATDQKAVEFLAGLPNTEVRISYNTDRERLHAKAYLFLRDSGFDTGYIGSSNISRSALTNGLEWNLKITTQEIPHIMDKFKSTFETYWASPEFETYELGNTDHQTRLKRALRKERGTDQQEQQFFFDIEPHAYQREILERLSVERSLHGHNRNLIVAATGTGKTVISAFDFNSFYKKHPTAKFLFVAHRKEILIQARKSYRMILRSYTFGELWVDGLEPDNYDQLFASVQTLNRRFDQLNLSSDFYDYIVIDEVHHISADSYRPIINHFEPQILLGLTATPERLDGSDIREDFCGTIAAELRLPEAINQRHLCPFQYFALDDPIDLSDVQWVRGRYLPSELTSIYTANDQRVLHILRSMDEIIGDLSNIKALAFCVTQEHAQFMAEKFSLKGVSSAVLTSANAQERANLREQLVQGKINILFVVDIFNEGVDIPEVDTVLFLRPTESLTIFLQQLGRGLRLSEGKDCLTVLDFVGNAHQEYDFTQKFRALVGKSHTSILDEVNDDFPHLPLGCSIVLQKQAKEVILRNIKKAIVNRQRLLAWIKGYKTQTDLPLTLSNFLNQYPMVTLNDIYKCKIDKGGGWSRLCERAGIYEISLDQRIEHAMYRGIYKRLLQCNSYSYLSFILKLMKNDGIWDNSDEIENQYALMVHYDFWQDKGSAFNFESLDESISALVQDQQLKSECIEVVSRILDGIEVDEIPMDLKFRTGLKIHARYSRGEILAAFGAHSFDKKSTNREGVVDIKDLNCEVLFVTLQKTEKKFSPTTLYHDYAINENLFHWQTQNNARPDKGKGYDYIHQNELGKTILLYVREKSTDEYSRAMGFINLGPVEFQSNIGQQPMNITWRLKTPLPSSLWNDAVKLAVG